MHAPTYRLVLALGFVTLAAGACSSDPEKKKCPPKGIGVEAFEGVSATDQVAKYKEYDCAEPQICPDVGGRNVRYPVDPAEAPGEVSFLLTNCATSGPKLEISKVVVYGDDRCFYTEGEVAEKAVDPGKDSVVRVSYKPTAPGKDDVELHVKSNAKNFPDFKLVVCAEGVVKSKDAGVAAADGGPPTRQDAGGAPAVQCKPTGLRLNGKCHKE
ncbi:MAG: hypothetical protein IT371_01225 [Deltaproteobacteria bacterium]|nr:hypothetical protein [Deltaproteobacteria bacterium]